MFVYIPGHQIYLIIKKNVLSLTLGPSSIFTIFSAATRRAVMARGGRLVTWNPCFKSQFYG